MYLYKKKTQVVFLFLFFISSNFHFYRMNALVYVDIDQGIHKGKMKVAQNEKRKKLLGFSFYTNIGNFEAFLWNLNLSKNRLFWRCELMLRSEWEQYFALVPHNKSQLFVYKTFWWHLVQNDGY